MAGEKGNVLLPSLPPPRPKSPPEYPDLFGKRRELAKVQMLEREIGFLREELKSIDGTEPASRSCKELADFVTGNLDPLLPIRTKGSQRSCCSWKWICGLPQLLFSCICCGGGDCCSSPCCCCNKMRCDSCCNTRFSCELPKCRWCCRSWKWSWNWCGLPKCCCCSFPSCRCRCRCRSWFKCRRNMKWPKLKSCCCYSCRSDCCYSCCFCF